MLTCAFQSDWEFSASTGGYRWPTVIEDSDWPRTKERVLATDQHGLQLPAKVVVFGVVVADVKRRLCQGYVCCWSPIASLLTQ